MASKGLGKGLSALISENNNVTPLKPVSANDAKDSVNTLPISRLQPGKYQPRERFDDVALKELADSIGKNGIMQPIIVRPAAKSGNKFEIIAGERRWRAAQLAKLNEVPVIVRDIDDKQALEFALVENIQRQDLSPLEEAAGYQRLIEEFNYTQEALGAVVGKSRSHIANLLRLLTLPDEVKTLLGEGKISMGHARALLTAENPVELAQKIASEGLSVRDAERYSKGAREKEAAAPRSSPGNSNTYRKPINKDPDIISLEESLSENLGLKVSINDRGQSGEIILSYDSLSQLDNILQRLGNSI